MKHYIKGFHTVLRQERGTVVMYGYTQFPTINLKETGKRIQLLRQQRGLSVRDMQQFFPKRAAFVHHRLPFFRPV